jgi:hypothetical protein
MEDILKLIDKTLTEDGHYCEYWQDANLPIVFYIRINGDWKHSHLRIDYLMKQIGLNRLGEKDVVDTESDWYESTHVYVYCK